LSLLRLKNGAPALESNWDLLTTTQQCYH